MKQILWCLCFLPLFCQAQQQSKPTVYDSAHYSWRKPVPRNRLRELQPDRPGVTESPFTVDAGHLQVEMDAVRLRNSGKGNDELSRELRMAYTMLKFGLGRQTDVQLEFPMYTVAKSRPAGTSEWESRNAAFGDLMLRVKHNFLGHEQDGSFALAVIGLVRLPSGGRVGQGGREYGMIVTSDIEVSDKANLEFQLASDLNYDREKAGRYLQFTPSVALEYDFTKKLGLITEGVGQWNTLQQRWEASFNIAPLLKLTPNVQLDAGTHIALNRLSDKEYFVGITVRR
ncbi:transporter [Hymenobacter arizonensis]|uniref:Putative MetA-pathway of phenol degradation n=1 Tax=Hymenobacter arizonensis TaxID=1227077 RepID=A0A1I5WU92_HYMAR|nr:transporter [Hymenobacter arizonensis]SFQ23260.1 Putative MetA-pathway of phenol degradation [Hymenobacter arizonensis]